MAASSWGPAAHRRRRGIGVEHPWSGSGGSADPGLAVFRRQAGEVRVALEDADEDVRVRRTGEGAAPVNISKSTHPNAHRSVRRSTGSRAPVRDSCRPRCRRSAPCASRHGGGVGCVRAGGVDFRQSEVEHLRVAVARDLDVGRLEVAMDEAALVRRLERRGDLRTDPQRLSRRRTDAAPIRSASVSPLTSFHDQAEAVANSSSP